MNSVDRVFVRISAAFLVLASLAVAWWAIEQAILACIERDGYHEFLNAGEPGWFCLGMINGATTK